MLATISSPFSEKNLRSVGYNLLSNALKYRHFDLAPAVRLTYFRQNRHHVLRVQNNGLGLDVAGVKDKFFGMSQRLHTHVEGSGIGLYIVKKYSRKQRRAHRRAEPTRQRHRLHRLFPCTSDGLISFSGPPSFPAQYPPGRRRHQQLSQYQTAPASGPGRSGVYGIKWPGGPRRAARPLPAAHAQLLGPHLPRPQHARHGRVCVPRSLPATARGPAVGRGPHALHLHQPPRPGAPPGLAHHRIPSQTPHRGESRSSTGRSFYAWLGGAVTYPLRPSFPDQHERTNWPARFVNA